MCACSCHGKNGVSAERVSAYDQCTACAKKHIVKAWNLWNEFTYTDENRDVISGKLRNAVDHLMYDHRETALMARNLAMLIEENRDAEIKSEWPDLLSAVRKDYYDEHPEFRKRLEALGG